MRRSSFVGLAVLVTATLAFSSLHAEQLYAEEKTTVEKADSIEEAENNAAAGFLEESIEAAELGISKADGASLIAEISAIRSVEHTGSIFDTAGSGHSNMFRLLMAGDGFVLQARDGSTAVPGLDKAAFGVLNLWFGTDNEQERREVIHLLSQCEKFATLAFSRPDKWSFRIHVITPDLDGVGISGGGWLHLPFDAGDQIRCRTRVR